MIHKFLRAVGFSKVTTKRQLRDLITLSIKKAKEKSYTTGSEEDSLFSEFNMEFGERIGITVRGEYDENNHFTFEYYFPYFKGEVISSTEDLSIERQAAMEAYLGVCDELRIGITLIFYVQNAIPYIRAKNAGLLPIKGTTLTLSALALSGKILLPSYRGVGEKIAARKESMERTTLMQAAKNGNEDAIETLTMRDMDIYAAVNRRIKDSDVYSIVNSTFMPYGIECDEYSILGEIKDIHETENRVTREKVILLQLACNDIMFDVCINKLDLIGEPMIGRRFKGIVWMQGHINFPEE